MKYIMWSVVWISGIAAMFAYSSINDPVWRIGMIIAIAIVSTMLFNNLLHDYVMRRIEIVTLTLIAKNAAALDKSLDKTE